MKNHVAKISLGVVVGLIGLFGFLKYQQTQTITEAIALVSSGVKLNSSAEIKELKEKKKQIEKAISLLDSIPNFPGSSYSEATKQKQQFQSQLITLQTTIEAKAAVNLADAKQIQLETKKVLKTLSYPLDILEQTKTKLETAISLLETIGDDTLISIEAQSLLTSYYQQQKLLNKKLEKEKNAQSGLQNAQNLAQEAIQLSANPPHPVTVWEQSISKWQEAIIFLELIPSDTMISVQAKKTLINYRNNLNNIKTRITAEKQALKSLELAQQSAQKIANFTANPPYTVKIWQQAQFQWEQVIKQLKTIPNSTTVYNQAQNLVSDYNQKLSTVNQQLEQQILADLKRELRPKIEAAIEQFNELNSILNSGINFKNYQAIMVDLLQTMNDLSKENNISKLRSFNKLLAALKNYINAYELWETTIDSAGSSYYLVKNILNIRLSEIWNEANNNIIQAQNNL